MRRLLVGCADRKSRTWVVAFCVGVFLLPCAHFALSAEKEEFPQRIISMSPGSTEVLFALGLGERVVGVTPYCSYPPEAMTKAKVGAFTDTNYEAIILLKPDLIVLLPSHRKHAERLIKLGLPCVVSDMRTVESIFRMMNDIGRRCGVQEKAAELVAEMKRRLERVQALTKGHAPLRVLVSVGRDLRSSSVRQVYLAGRGLFHDDLLKYVGAVNAFTREGIAYPVVSAEGIIRMRPDVILEMAPWLAGHPEEIKLAEAAWKSLKVLPAVQTGRVYVLGGDYVSVPGPRVVQTVEDMARSLYPDIDFKSPVQKIDTEQGRAEQKASSK